jgi:hypothetical protein
MDLRAASMSEEPASPVAGTPVTAPATEVSFRVDGRLTAARIAGTVVFALLALVFQAEPERLLFAAGAALVCAGYAVRDLVAPRRLAADAAGVTVVTGFAGRRRLGWDQIEAVRVDERRRLGLRSATLEIDAGDDLYLFSAYDLGIPCDEAAGTLAGVAPARD